MTDADRALDSVYSKLRFPPPPRLTAQEIAAVIALIEAHQRGEVKLPAQAKARSR